MGIHGQLNKGASWGPAAQVALLGWGCGGLRVAAPIMWGAPAPACGPGSWRRCRKCVVIDSRTFKYPPCNKNRLPASPARQRLALCWRGAAEPSRAEPSGAERGRPSPGPCHRLPPARRVAREAVSAAGLCTLLSRSGAGTKRCGGEGCPAGRGVVRQRASGPAALAFHLLPSALAAD